MSAAPAPAPAIDFGPVPPLVIGVSGVMDFPSEAVRQQVKAAVKKFLWRFVVPPAVPPKDDTHEDWSPLPHTPVAVLSSLAPGADWMLVEVVNELNDEYKALPDDKKVKERPYGFKAYGALPFPAELYARATTYTGPNGVRDRDAARDGMLALAKTEHAFFVPLREDAEACDQLPEVTDPKCSQADVNEAREKCVVAGRLARDLTSDERQQLRYRAAGEYTAAHSHLMLILNDRALLPTTTPDEVRVPVATELPGTKIAAGAVHVLEAKRQGITPGLLRSEVAFTWADSGPVVHFHTPAGEAVDAGKLTVLYPVDTRLKEGADVANNEPNWMWEAGAKFGAVLAQLEAFNADTVAHLRTQSAETPGAKLAEMLTLPASPAGARKGDVAAFADGLDRLARAHERADAVANKNTGAWKWFLFLLFLLTFVAAMLLHLGLHWHTAAAAGHAPAGDAADPHHAVEPTPAADANAVAAARAFETVVRVGTPLAAAVLIVFTYWRFQKFKDSQREECRFDYRAVAEGLKVQTYWAAAGLPHSVSANYMQRQRNEMVWIRRAITALAAPYTRWAAGFAALTEREQLTLLSSVVTRWVRWEPTRDPNPDAERATRGAQAGWMERAGYEDHRAERFWKRVAVAFSVTGVGHIAIWLVSVFFPGLLADHACPNWWLVTALVVVGVFTAAWLAGSVWAFVRKRTGKHLHGFPKPNCWRKNGVVGAVLGGFVWVWELIHPHDWLWELRHAARGYEKSRREKRYRRFRYLNVAALALVGCLISYPLIHWLGERTPLIPNACDWWTFVIGALLVAGALAFTWPERHLMAEHARQYESMWAMYQAAGRRLLGHLSAAEDALKANDLRLFRGRVKAIQELLYQVGLQALDENAEWLILHRSRPLEPLMAG